MAVSSYLRECGYELGGLLPKIYLIHKNALKLSFKAKGIEVSVSNNKDGDIYVLEGSMVQYKQEETYNGKYRFTSTLEITINEQYKEPFFYGLRTLRTNQYYIIIEDKKGIQYLINPELYTKMTYEYSFGDGEGAINNVVINYNNLSNYPLLIFNENISNSKSFFGSECVYNYGQAIELLLFDHKDLKIKDDGVKAESMYIEDVNMIKRVEYMKESLTLSEAYDGTGFTTTLSFSIPLDDKYGWAYRLLEFQDNKYSCIIQTTNDNYIIGGIERGLFPSFSVETSEEDSIPNIVNVKMEQRSQYPLLWTDELSQYRWTEVEPLCFGYDKYQMLVKEKSTDWGETWIRTDVKKKGNVICYDCEDCKEYQWEEDGTICGELTQTTIEWVNTDEFLCENGNKYHKTQQKIDGVLQEVYGFGELIEENSEDCRYIAVKWVDDGYNCYEVNEDLNERGDKVGEECSGTTLMNKYSELVTHNGEDYFESGEFFYDEERTNCCACGYREEEWRTNGYICGKDMEEEQYLITSKDLKGGWWTLRFQGVPKVMLNVGFVGNNTNNLLYIGQMDRNLEKVYNTALNQYFWHNVYVSSWSINQNFTFDIGDENEHYIQFYIDSNYSYTPPTAYIRLYGFVDEYSQYQKHYKYLICDDGVDVVAEQTDELNYLLYEEKSCNCGWTGLTWVFNDEYICGSELFSYSITSVSGDWIREGNTFTSNTIGHSQLTIERINFYVKTPTDIVLNIDQSSENYYDYLIVSNIDKPVSSSPSSSNNYASWQNKTTGSVTIPATTIGEHFIELMYKKDGSTSSYRDNVIVTFNSVYDENSKYEIWRETHLCDVSDFTGNVEYRNPQLSYDCGWVSYQWRVEETDVCGTDLPDNVTEVEEAPEINTDF